MTIRDKVYSFKTKYKEGFVKSEIEELLKDYPDVNKEKFDDALAGITCMVKDENIVIYHCDIETALKCGVENRDIGSHEWD